MEEVSGESIQSGLTRLEDSMGQEESSAAFSAPDAGARWSPQEERIQADNHAIPLGAAMGSAQIRSGRWAVSQSTRSVAAARPHTPLPDPGFQSILERLVRQAPRGNTNALMQQLTNQADQVSRRASENAARRRGGDGGPGGGGVGPGAAVRGDRGVRPDVPGRSRVRPAEIPAQVLRGPATRPRYTEPAAVLRTSRATSPELMPPPPPVVGRRDPSTPVGQRISLLRLPHRPQVPHVRPAVPPGGHESRSSQSHAQPNTYSSLPAGPPADSPGSPSHGQQVLSELLSQRPPSETSGNARFAPSAPISAAAPRELFSTRNPLEIAEQHNIAQASAAPRPIRVPRQETSSKSHMRFRIRSQFTLDPLTERDRYPQAPWGDRGPNHKTQLSNAYTNFIKVLTRKYNREMDRKHPRMRTIPIIEITNDFPGIAYDTLQNEYLEWTWIFHDVANQERMFTLLSPIFHTNPGDTWREHIEAVWKFLNENYRVTSEKAIHRSQVHVWFDPKCKLDQLQSLAASIIHFEPAFEALAPVTADHIPDRSNWLYSHELAARGLGRTGAIEFIVGAVEEEQLIEMMQNPTSRAFAWNFLDYQRDRLIECRRCPSFLTAEDALSWIELIMSFVRAAMQLQRPVEVLPSLPRNLRGLCDYITGWGSVSQPMGPPPPRRPRGRSDSAARGTWQADWHGPVPRGPDAAHVSAAGAQTTALDRIWYGHRMCDAFEPIVHIGGPGFDIMGTPEHLRMMRSLVGQVQADLAASSTRLHHGQRNYIDHTLGLELARLRVHQGPLSPTIVAAAQRGFLGPNGRLNG